MKRWLLGASLGALVMALVSWLVVANLPNWASKVEVQGLTPPLGLAAGSPAPASQRPSPSPPTWSGPPVGCGSDTAQLTGITARLSGTQLTLSGLSTQAATVTIAPPVFPGFSPASVILWPLWPTTTQPVSVFQPLCLARFGSESRPTLLLGLTTGGAHCCGIVRAYPLTASGIGKPVDKAVGNPSAAVWASGDHAVIVTADNAFAGQFSSFAGSGMPISVWEFTAGAFANTTPQHPEIVRADAAQWWHEVTITPAIGLGLLAPWVADECVLGQGPSAWAVVNVLQAQHRLGGAPADLPSLPTGAAYVTTLHTFLTQQGYCA